MKTSSRWILALSALAAISGCSSCNSPAGPSNNPGGGPTTTYFLNEGYESLPYTGTWLGPDAESKLGFVYGMGTAATGYYAVTFEALSLTANPFNGHFRNTFANNTTTATLSTPLTTTFRFHYASLSPTASDPIQVSMQMSNDGATANIMWSFEIFGNGTSYRFNTATLSPCPSCPAAGTGTGWHKVTIKSTGNVTQSIAFDNSASFVPSQTTYPGPNTSDNFGFQILHVTTGDILNTTGAKFMMDDLVISTP